MGETPEIRVLVVGDDPAEQERLVGLLTESGSVAARATDPRGTVDLVLAHGPRALMRSHAARGRGDLASEVALVYLPLDPAGVLLSSELAGAADEVIPVPVSDTDLCERIAALLRVRSPRSAVEWLERARDMLTEVGNVLISGLDISDILHEVVVRLAEMMGADRGSLILFGDDPTVAYVMAASDDPNLTKLPILIEKYPEINAARESRDVLVVENAPSSALLGEFAEAVAAREIGSVVCLPLNDTRQVRGVILLRFAGERLPKGVPLSFGSAASSMVALGLRGTEIFERLREQTRRLSLARYERERRMRVLERYRDFLESSTDGMFVTDAGGTVLSVNRAAEQLTGFAREALCSRAVFDLVGEQQREPLAEAIRQVSSGTSLQNFDLELRTTSGDPLIVSCATSSVLAEQNAAVISFRDVTEARALQNELTKTKEFLERLIDSTVDGIIAADIRGNIIIFNKGAERVTGHRAEDVIGTLHVERLYAAGVAREVMQELRSETHGGVGRLELCRRELLSREGMPVPVNMTASIIYEEGREVATVGVFSDLRERLKIEASLQQAQEKLVISEKQALIAELAGTTAHELNQPLTSVMGCVELLGRRMGEDHSHEHLLENIVKETERMAEIVRKIGRITRYETKTYVGSTQILDLDKSTD